jgi:hypothetical protein
MATNTAGWRHPLLSPFAIAVSAATSYLSRSRRMSRSVIAAVIPALGVMILTAPAAYAQSEQSITAECNQASGAYSSYVTTLGNRYSTCCYKTFRGKLMCDLYKNGDYLSTYDPTLKKLPPGAPAAPSIPPVAPPISDAPPEAH